MRRLKSLIIAGSMLVCGIAANAQTDGATSNSFLSKVTAGGYNQANISYVSQGFSNKIHYANNVNDAMHGNAHTFDSYFASLQGFGIEYIRGFKVSKKLPMYVEAGAAFNFGFGEASGYTAQFIGLDIPLSYAYKFNIKNKFTIKPYIGLDLKVGLMGRNLVDEDDESSEWTNWYDEIEWSDSYNNDDDEEEALKRFNLGWHIGVDFYYRSYSIGLDFASDITKIYKSRPFDINCSVFALKLGYTF